MISPKIEESRIQLALRGCGKNDLDVYEANELIKKALEEFDDDISVSCSFGSCSVVVLHMVLQQRPRIKVIFCNTGVEYPETYAYRDLLVKEWDLNYFETNPLKTFWQCVKQYGLPHIRAKWKGLAKPKCCHYLKELPMKQICKKLGIKATITGLRCAESRARMFSFHDRGQFYFAKMYNQWRYHPIGFWTHKQVWNYIEEHGIPVNAIYKTNDRNGCMPCTGFKGWQKIMAKTNPKLYKHIQKLRGVTLIDTFLNLEDEAFNVCNQLSPRKRQSFLESWF